MLWIYISIDREILKGEIYQISINFIVFILFLSNLDVLWKFVQLWTDPYGKGRVGCDFNSDFYFSVGEE